ncbi:MAG TPA: WD40 repeat domain-containing protein [Gemmataceae bacterium]|nr:WD40 repeat domain-containing protein [Gemmataceae bacterium]
MDEQGLIPEGSARGKLIADTGEETSPSPPGKPRREPSLLPSRWAVIQHNLLLALLGIYVGGVVGANAGATDLGLDSHRKKEPFHLLLSAGGLAAGLGLVLAAARTQRRRVLMLVGGGALGTGTIAMVGHLGWWDCPWPPLLAVGLTVWGTGLGAMLGKSRGEWKAGALVGLLLFGSVSLAAVFLAHPDPAGLFGAVLGLLGGTLLWWRRGRGQWVKTVQLGIVCLVLLTGAAIVPLRNAFWPRTLRCGPARKDFYNPRGAVEWVVFSPDGRQVLASHHTGCELWDADTGRLLASFPTDKGYIASVGFAADVPLCVTLKGNLAQQWDVRDTALLSEIELFRAVPPEKIDFDWQRPKVVLASDGRSALYALPGEGALRVLDFKASQERIVLLPDVPPVWAVAWDTSRGLAFLGCGDTTVRLWDVGKHGDPRELRVSGGLNDVARQVTLSADGRRALVVHRDGSLKVWDVPRWELFRQMEAGRHRPRAALSSDGERVVAAVGRATVVLWDVESGAALRHFLNHQCFALLGKRFYPEAVAISPDGKRGATLCTDGSVRVWDLDN